MWKKFEDLMSLVFEYVGMFLEILMVLVVCYTIVTRYLFSYTPAWGEAAALLCMVWFGFLSIALGVRDELHLSVGLLDSLFSERVSVILALCKHVIIICCGIFMITQGYAMVNIGKLNMLSGLKLSSGVLYAAVPVSGLAIVAYSLTHVGETLRMLQDIGRDKEGGRQ